jgi:ankyrin repeat protein
MSLELLLFAAIQRGASADVESIIDTDKVSINARDAGGWTPLMRATAGDHLDIIRFLLAKGADPTLRDKKGLTALSLASPQAKAVLDEFLRDDVRKL